MGYYDRVLGGMLAALVLGMAAGFHPVIAFHYGLFSGAVLATLLLWEAVFRNPPVPPSDPRVAGATAVWHGGLALFAILAW